MRKLLFAIIFLQLSLFVHGQLSAGDSLIIFKLHASKITDSINSQVPKAIRIVITEYLQQKKMDPSSFYTIGKFIPSSNDSVAYLSILRIGALRDLSDEYFFPGAAGGEGDDLLIIFDNEYKTIKRIINSE